MNPFVSGFRPVFLIVTLMLICLFAFITVGGNSTCVSDGCIAVVLVALITWGLVVIQLLVVIPIYAVRQVRQKLPAAKWVIAWASVSVLPALVAHLIVFWKYL